MNTLREVNVLRDLWTTHPDLARLAQAVASHGGDARIVGGAVRDVLLGREVGDIDLATTLLPDEIMKALANAGIKAVPTGFEHGTITAVVGGKGYEITTLRHDVETDGRHAKVAFTDDWQADAARRDFTMNALFVDQSGKLYDYFNGLADLKQRKVRFIGCADDRIREDVLRIMRFFRFLAWLGDGEADAEGLASCQRLAHLIPTLSVERVWKELKRLLEAPDPRHACALMHEGGICAYIMPEMDDPRRAQALIDLELRNHVPPFSLRRLAALLAPCRAEEIARRLRFSRKELAYVVDLEQVPPMFKDACDERMLRRALYSYGLDITRDGLLLAAASGAALDVARALDYLPRWSIPVFPLQGSDLLAQGMEAGPELGKLLEAIERWWIDQDFGPDKAACLNKAKSH